MRLSISSVLTANIFIIIIILLVYPLLRSSRFLKLSGTRWVMVLFVGVLIRLIFPIELPYAHSIYFTGVFTTARQVLTYKILPGDEYLTIYQLLLFLWAAGIVVSAWKKGRTYFQMKRVIRSYGRRLTREELERTGNFFKDCPELRRVEIIALPGITSPLMIGIRKKTILLPESSFSEREFSYILSHEAMHIRNHDILWKLFIDILCTVYWWNPILSLVKEEAFQVIEINNDLTLTKEMSRKEKEEYLDCLYKVAKMTISAECVCSVSFATKGAKELKQRFELVVHGISGKKLFHNLVSALVIGSIYLSTCVVFEPSFPSPEGPTELTEENTYVIFRNQTYEVYVDGNYLFSTDNLKYLPDDMEIVKEEMG